jgi:hypothetical protein
MMRIVEDLVNDWRHLDAHQRRAGTIGRSAGTDNAHASGVAGSMREDLRARNDVDAKLPRAPSWLVETSYAHEQLCGMVA